MEQILCLYSKISRKLPECEAAAYPVPETQVYALAGAAAPILYFLKQP